VRVLATTLAVAGLAVAGLAACTSSREAQGTAPESQTSTLSASPSPPVRPSSAPDEAGQVLARYAAFWTLVTAVSQAPALRRRAMLVSYVTEPELGRLLRGLLAADAVGEGVYGAAVPHARVTSIRGDMAAVTDCQDASRSGRTRRATGKPINRGVPRNPVQATLRRGPDGRWRTSTVHFVGGSC